ncbi:MAG: hypothetical protein AB7Q97_01950 [Gammaproteobacteria bacterium]
MRSYFDQGERSAGRMYVPPFVEYKPAARAPRRPGAEDANQVRSRSNDEFEVTHPEKAEKSRATGRQVRTLSKGKKRGGKPCPK